MSGGGFDLPADLARAVAQAASAGPTAEAARRALGLLDFTSLGEDDDEAGIAAFCRRAATPFGAVAGVCLYPRFVPLARRLLAGSGIRVVTVANFPDGAADPDRAAAETAAAVAEGADEVDIVYPTSAELAGDRQAGPAVVAACRRAAGDRPLKVILETALIPDADRLRAICRTALDGGADFLKTSTGKRGGGATLPAAAVMLDEIRRSGRTAGLKPSGGIRSTADAAGFLALAAALMGDAYLAPATFRLGASSVLDDLLATLGAAPGEPAPASSY